MNATSKVNLGVTSKWFCQVMHQNAISNLQHEKENIVTNEDSDQPHIGCIGHSVLCLILQVIYCIMVCSVVTMIDYNR